MRSSLIRAKKMMAFRVDQKKIPKMKTRKPMPHQNRISALKMKELREDQKSMLKTNSQLRQMKMRKKIQNVFPVFA
jgi:hypothetical protein